MAPSRVDKQQSPVQGQPEQHTWQGYARPDGRKGIRNRLLVVYLVECARHVAEEIAAPFRRQDVEVLGFPGCYPSAYAERILRQLTTHPNVGGALLVSLGCESFDRDGAFAILVNSSAIERWPLPVPQEASNGDDNG